LNELPKVLMNFKTKVGPCDNRAFIKSMYTFNYLHYTLPLVDSQLVVITIQVSKKRRKNTKY